MNHQLRRAEEMVATKSAEALRIVDDPRLNVKTKLARVKALEDEIKHWAAEAASIKSVQDYARSIPLHEGAEDWTDRRPAGVATASHLSAEFRSAPPLVVPEHQAMELFDAAVSRKSLGLKIVDSTAAPMATAVPFQFPPIAASREPQRVLSLIPTAATDRPSVEFYITTGTANAAAVAEGGVKPTSNLSFTKGTAYAVKIAHVVEATQEAVEDFQPFLSLINSDMVGGVIAAENTQILNGSGVAPNMLGLLNVSGVLTRATGTDTNLDALEQAMLDLRTGARFAEPDGIVMHPAAYSKTRRIKDSQGNYIAGNPLEAGPSSLWGIPVVLTTSMPAGVALVGNFATAAQAFIRSGLTVETNAYGTTQFTNNTILIRAEERIILAPVRPAAVVKVTGLAT